jgi:RNA recognition motif-containing protein
MKNQFVIRQCGVTFSSLFFLLVDLPFLGFAFVYFEDERDGDDAIRALDGYPFGPGRRRLSVEWSRVISLALLVTLLNLNTSKTVDLSLGMND